MTANYRLRQRAKGEPTIFGTAFKIAKKLPNPNLTTRLEDYAKRKGVFIKFTG